MSNSVSVPVDSSESIKVIAFSNGITAFDLLDLNVRAYAYELRTQQAVHKTIPLTRQNAKNICKVTRSAPTSNQILGDRK